MKKKIKKSEFEKRMEWVNMIPTDSPPEEWNAFPSVIRKILMDQGYSADGKAPKPTDPPAKS